MGSRVELRIRTGGDEVRPSPRAPPARARQAAAGRSLRPRRAALTRPSRPQVFRYDADVDGAQAAADAPLNVPQEEVKSAREEVVGVHSYTGRHDHGPMPQLREGGPYHAALQVRRRASAAAAGRPPPPADGPRGA